MNESTKHFSINIISVILYHGNWLVLSYLEMLFKIELTMPVTWSLELKVIVENSINYKMTFFSSETLHMKFNLAVLCVTSNYLLKISRWSKPKVWYDGTVHIPIAVRNFHVKHERSSSVGRHQVCMPRS